MKYKRIPLWLLLFLVTACSLLEPPPAPSIPTPRPTPLPFDLQFIGSEIPVLDPVNDLFPSVDSDITFLVESVSNQNLMAYVQTLEGFGTRNTFSDTTRDDFGIGAARRWLFSEFQRVGVGRLDVQFPGTIPLHFQGLTHDPTKISLPTFTRHKWTTQV